MLAGGHSIDSPEPIFGLAVTGQVSRERLQQNNSATAGCRLYLTKPLGIGVLTTAQKQKKLLDVHRHLARDVMCQLNRVGATAAGLGGVRAMTDVTGFGLLGHLLEICEGSDVDAVVCVDSVPVLEPVPGYIEQGCIPGGTGRNFNSYGRYVDPMDEATRALLCDPQTSGGLLIAVEPEDGGAQALEALLRREGLHAEPLGELVPRGTASSPRIRLV
jgi:selenide,water dikinase